MLQIFKQTVTADAESLVPVAVGLGSQYPIQAGDRMALCFVANGAAPAQAVFLQHSIDTVTWRDLPLRYVAYTDRSYAGGTVSVGWTRDLSLTAGGAADGVSIGRINLTRGFIRAVVRCDAVPGSQDVEVWID